VREVVVLADAGFPANPTLKPRDWHFLADAPSIL
jgi:hypothetical protein